MKYKYLFAFILISTILFSLGTSVASEDIGLDTISSDDACLSTGLVDSQDYSTIDADNRDVQGSVSSLDAVGGDASGAISGLETESNDVQNSLDEDDVIENDIKTKKALIKDSSSNSSKDGVDLSVDMGLGDIKRYSTGFNQIVFNLSFITTVMVDNGTAKNVKVYQIMPEDFEYVSHTANIGAYNPNTGIWEIGDLDSSQNASLTVLTKIKSKGTFVVSVNATTDSYDVYLPNNDLECNVQVSSKITSNTTRTSDDINGPQHDIHQASMYNEGIVNRESKENDPAGRNNSPNGESQNAGTNSNDNSKTESGSGTGASSSSSSNGGNSGSNSGSSSNNGDSSNSESGANSGSGTNNLIKQISPNILTAAVGSLSKSVNNILNLGDDSEDKDSNSKFVKAANVYDYTQIPIFIFALFFVALLGILGYDKIKS